MAVLYVVSTPIGNLGDVTYRAIEVLRTVQRVLAEDTRRTAILFRRYGIDTPRYSAHAHNEAERLVQVLAWLEAGENIALVSDAGTPLLSDPGARIVRGVIDAGHTVVPVPGASALLSALVVSGLEPEPFTFFGFPPRTGAARTKRLAEAASSPWTSVFYEAPGRLRRLLSDLAEVCGADRPVSVARELTKLHEAVFRGTLEEASHYYRDTSIRGEVVVVLAGAGPAAAPAAGEAAALVRALLREGLKPSAAAREAARRLSIPRSEAYRLALGEAGRREE